MSVVGFEPLPIDIFGGLDTDTPPPDLPLGSSPANQDAQFKMGSWETRPASLPAFSGLAGNPTINGLVNYTTPSLIQRMLALGSDGIIQKETAPGVLVVVGAVEANQFMQGKQGFGREYMAFSTGGLGSDMPRQFDDTFLDRVSQTGPGGPPTAADEVSGPIGSVTAGVHGVSVFFRTRQGFDTAPAPVGSWTAAGGKRVQLSDIPIGPSNVIARIICFTAAGGASYFFVADTMIIGDNTTTAIVLDFLDSDLLSGTNVDEYFNKVELGECAAFAVYADRLFGFCERAKLETFNNLSFDGGWNLTGGTGGADLPLGWASDATFGAGGEREQILVVWGDAYRLVADGVSVQVGLISQSAATDTVGDALCQPAIGYSVRARVMATQALATGTFRINAFSPTLGQIGQGLAVTAAQATNVYTEFIAELFPAAISIPSDLELRVYADGVPAPAGESFYVDCIEVFETNQPYNQTLVRASLAGLPECFDGETGLVEPLDAGDQLIMCGFQLRDRFYLVGQKWLGSTQDDKTNEPALWDISEVSNKVGTMSPRGVGFGEEWAVIADRAGLYIVWGGNEPIKISQEIQDVWDAVNWAAGYAVWVEVDTTKKRILVGVPMGSATTPTKVFYFDYRGLDTATDIASYHSVRYSSYSGKILAIGDARKWSVWNIVANSGGLIERADGTQHMFIGNGISNGKIYDLVDAEDFPDDVLFGDDGVGVPFSYSTYYTPGHLDETQLQLGAGRKLYGYLRGYVEGAGVMDVTAQPLGNITPTKLGSISLVTANPIAIASVTRLNGITTVVTAEPHGLQPTDTQAVLAGVTDESFVGTAPIQIIVNPTMFKIYQYGLPNADSTGGTANRLLRDFEMTTNVLCERLSYTFSNHGNALGSWARMEKLVPYMKTDPFAPVRGVA